MSALTFDYEFTPAEHGTPEDRATTAELRLSVGEDVATRVEDAWARSVRERVRVACYPLATWLAASWWRLLHEPPSLQATQAVGWRLTHQLAAAGGGYLWPRLTFVPDGEGIDLECRPSRRTAAEPLRYLASFRVTAPAAEVERELAAFVSSVVARLDAVGLTATDLHALWADVQAERADADASRVRTLEAVLGFDPDEAPQPLLAALSRLDDLAGREAVAEIASAAGAGRTRRLDPAAFVRAVDELAHAPGLAARFSAALRGCAPRGGPSARPWQRGRELATHLRQVLGLDQGPITDQVLADLLGGDFARAPASGPIGLAVRATDDRATLHFRRASVTARRFEAARFVAEQALAPATERWLPSTDAATARQKVQRAFAAEFLAPIGELEARLAGDTSAEALEAAAEEYRVSPLAIASHLANHGLLAPEDVRGR